MIQTADYDSIVCNRGRGLETILGGIFPDDTAIAPIKTIEIAIGCGKIDPVTVNRRLTRPGGTTPGILVEAALYPAGFDLPNDLQRPGLPWAGAVKVTLRIA